MNNYLNNDTIVAPATAAGVGAIAVVRLSGSNAIEIADKVFASKNLKSKNLKSKNPNTIHFGVIHNNGVIIDEVLLSLFKAPHSYTGEDVIELSCHGSPFIVQQIIQLLIKQGARMTNAGEFTLRAFMNAKLDLSQAEAVADLIASNSAASHQLAMQQMRGGFSNEIKHLREQLINFASLIELELDFGEEDVEFANRSELLALINKLQLIINKLVASFEVGNVLKNGVPVAIVGKPNAGKSTLLNTLVNEERAIVSEIAGTTRDTIEETIQLGGIQYRFIDTAGIRTTTDTIEAIGVAKAYEKIGQAKVVLYLFDVNTTSVEELKREIAELRQQFNNSTIQQLLLIGNKIDTSDKAQLFIEAGFDNLILISARDKGNIDKLINILNTVTLGQSNTEDDVIITNTRHLEALQQTSKWLQRVVEGLQSNVTSDFIAMDIRQSLHYLGLITGEVTTDDLLENIFRNFCIGK